MIEHTSEIHTLQVMNEDGWFYKMEATDEGGYEKNIELSYWEVIDNAPVKKDSFFFYSKEAIPLLTQALEYAKMFYEPK